MPVQYFKAIKAALVTALGMAVILPVAYWAFESDANATVVFAGVLLWLIHYTADTKEVQLAGIISATFFRDQDGDHRDDTEDDRGLLFLIELLPEPLRQYYPSLEESGEHTGPFSTFAEYHSAGIGFVAFLSGDLELAVAYAFGAGGGKARRSGHLRDVVKEPAYLAVGAIAGAVVRAAGLYP